MKMKITNRVVAAYLKCTYKAYLLLRDNNGSPHDYELLMDELQAAYKPKAEETLLRRRNLESAPPISIVSLHDLKQGHPLILDCIIETTSFRFHFDGLKKVDGKSALGPFHYIPIMFCHDDKIREQHRLMSAFGALCIHQIQQRTPEIAITISGPRYKESTFQIAKRCDRMSRVKDHLLSLCNGNDESRVRLNEHCSVCEFHQRCATEAKTNDDLSQLRGITDSQLTAYRSRGIFTVNQLSYTFRPRRSLLANPPISLPHYPALKALAVETNTTYFFDCFSLPTPPVQIFLDLEGDLNSRKVYLIGVKIVNDQTTANNYFWASEEGEFTFIFDKFLELFRRHSPDDFVLFHYGMYEQGYLRRMRKHARSKRVVDCLLDHAFDLYPIFRSYVYLPTYSNSLKAIAGFLGHSWSDEPTSGLQSVVHRKRWEMTREPHLKNELIKYNSEDVGALQTVTRFLRAVVEPDEQVNQSKRVLKEPSNIVPVNELLAKRTETNWRHATFVLPEFGEISKCAHFDYQREKVLVRTNATIRRAFSQKQKKSRSTPRVNKRLWITVRKCPFCKSSKIRSEKRVKRKLSFDLKVTKSGVTRQVIECRAHRYYCQRCGKSFLPERYKRRDKHFHSLRSWAIHQHVEYLASFSQLVSMFHEYFGIAIDPAYMYMFQGQMAHVYRRTYDQILRNIFVGNVLHIDETEVKHKDGVGYVWVFASLEDVYYMYRPSRKGAFLPKLLEPFRGVLISDFFSAYESLPCLQQKCLVHLLRDINKLLLQNPYDIELREVSQGFGALLQEIIETADRFGLKRYHLRKHKNSATAFLDSVVSTRFRSQSAELLRNRFERNRERLFTFLNHDEMPWNNNHAENAVKAFAKYRDHSMRVVTEKGLRDFLVLLSLCQTCKFKGISFLDFLLSKEKNFDNYRSFNRAKRKMMVEVYPNGFPRRCKISREDLRETAKTNGVETLFEKAASLLTKRLEIAQATVNSGLVFSGSLEKTRVLRIFFLLPGESDPSNGLRYNVYTKRFADYFGITVSRVRTTLPGYNATDQTQRKGSEFGGGYLSNESEIAQLRSILERIR